MKIAVDVMGGDHAPEEIIAGALKFAGEKQVEVVLVGKNDVIENELKKYDYDAALVSVVEASQVIEMDESPAIALRKKRDASIVVATKLVKEQVADAVLSCGSTGAQMAAAIFILGRMEGIERPPIVAQIPNADGKYSLLIDVGANVDCRPRQLLQFALLGKVYAATVLDIEQPRVALLNNGEEESKGNNLCVETYNLLRAQQDINFIGNIEGRDLFNAKSDVIVCDGFTGNILLKTIEGMAIFMAKNVYRQIGKLPSIFDKMDYTQIGGAPLLGVNGVSIVCHGSSKREAVYNGMGVAYDCVRKNIVALQESELAQAVSETDSMS